MSGAGIRKATGNRRLVRGWLRATGLSVVRRLFLASRHLAAALLLLPLLSSAAVLPEDRADVLYHRYEGGGVTVDGPSVLVRKKLGEKFSVTANYYVDMVSSASIDVLSTASPYKEKRVQKSLGVDYLRGKTLYSLNYINSDEHDYTADTASFGLSHDMFGDLTTVNLGYSRGWDQVGKRGDPTFDKRLDRRSYTVGLSQIITKRLIASLDYEVMTDEGFLNNPYRSIRYLDPLAGSGFSYAPEVYPHTHTSNAVALSARYFLPYRAALRGNVRYSNDTWGIGSQTAEIGYTQPFKTGWQFETSYRYYQQNAADFYSDLFPRADFQNFMARDKELAAFHSHTLRVGATYDFLRSEWKGLSRGSVTFYIDHIEYQYEDFRNVLKGGPPGTEPLYSFGANVIQCFVSVWF